MSVNHHNPAATADLAPADEAGTPDEHLTRCDDCGNIHRTKNDHSEWCDEQ